MAWIDAVDAERACCSWVVSDGRRTGALVRIPANSR